PLSKKRMNWNIFFTGPAEIQHLISGNRYNGKEDFAVVLQPFLHNYFIPHIGEGEVDPSFFSLDCFHISERAHAEMAVALWNNMLEPIGRKQTYNNFTYDRFKIHCPSEVFNSPAPIIPVAKCPSSLPVWVPVVVGIVSLLAGIVITRLILASKPHKSKVEKALSLSSLSCFSLEGRSTGQNQRSYRMNMQTIHAEGPSRHG
uniref:Phospholipase B1, membrane-associated n=1 Tax=Cyclopterus lumpus TaxID=8103 RepID=A0A8C2ZAA2_CYCLU